MEVLNIRVKKYNFANDQDNEILKNAHWAQKFSKEKDNCTLSFQLWEKANFVF